MVDDEEEKGNLYSMIMSVEIQKKRIRRGQDYSTVMVLIGPCRRTVKGDLERATPCFNITPAKRRTNSHCWPVSGESG